MAIVLRIVVGFKDLPILDFRGDEPKKEQAKHGVGLFINVDWVILIVAWEEADLFAIMYQEYICSTLKLDRLSSNLASNGVSLLLPPPSSNKRRQTSRTAGSPEA